jgi:twitching motility protein PilI
MSERVALHEYQEALARRLQDKSGAASASTHISLRSGGGDWLIDLRDAQEIIPVPALTRVPLVQPWLRGLANVRGGLIAVIDFAGLRGEAATELSVDARLLVLAPRYGVSAGLLVMRSGGLVNAHDLVREPMPGLRPAWAAAVYRDPLGALHYALATDELVKSDVFLGAALQ